jgi:hypothetical protein
MADTEARLSSRRWGAISLTAADILCLCMKKSDLHALAALTIAGRLWREVVARKQS